MTSDGSPLGFSRAARLLVLGGSFVVVVAGMRAAGDILVPFLLAMFLALLCLPAVRWMHQRKIPDAAAVPAVLILVFAVGALLAALLTQSMREFAAETPTYADLVGQKVARVDEKLESLLDIGGDDVDPAEGKAEKKDRIPDEIRDALSKERIVGFVGGVVGQLTGLLSNLFLIVLMVVFLLFELLGLPRKMAAIHESGSSLGNFNRIVTNINRYIAIKTFVSFLTGAAAGLGCLMLGVPHAMLWGLTAFLLNFIPNVGSVLAAIPPFVLCVVLPELGWTEGLAVAGIYFGINFVFGNIVEPRMMGRSLDLSTLIVFISMVFWGWVFGPVGMFLSVPLTMVLKIGLETSPTTQPIAILLGAAAPESVATRIEEPPQSS